jgi:hypothetical protein
MLSPKCHSVGKLYADARFAMALAEPPLHSLSMQIGQKIEEAGLLLRDGGAFYLRRDAGGRYALDLRRTPIDEVEKRVMLIGTYVGGDLVDVDGVSLL